MDRTPHSAKDALRPDLQAVADLIEDGEKVLEIGCSDGALLSYLTREKNADCRGLELDQAKVNKCASEGLFVIQGDAALDLDTYPDQAFDTVIVVRTLQTVSRPDRVLQSVARIGKRVIVTVPNFGQWRVRMDLFKRGRMPMTSTLSTPWFATDNIHFCTLRDFDDLTQSLGLSTQAFFGLTRTGKRVSWSLGAANWRADQGLYILESR